MYCKKCGKDIGDNYSCPFCGYGEKPQKPMHMNSVPKKPQNTQPVQSEVFTPIPPSQSTIMYSDKNKWVAFFLCLFLGFFGIHRFYVGKVKTGVLWLFTFGVFYVGWIVDLIMISSGKFKDNYGYLMK